VLPCLEPFHDAIDDLLRRNAGGIDGEMRAPVLGQAAGEAIFRWLGGDEQGTHGRLLVLVVAGVR
jgi:hypothetical protein